MAYMNLKAEMARKEMSIKQLAQILNKSVSKVSKNINNTGGDFSVAEALFIQKNIFPESEIEYLFRKDSDEKQNGRS